MKHTKIALVLLFLLVFAGSLFANATAEEYPSKPIDIVLGASAGSGGDISSRIIAKYLGQELGVTINVINTPGGSGVPAVQSVLSAPANGYTLMSDQGFSSTNQTVLEQLPYDVFEDRTYICKIISGPQVLCGNPKMGWSDIRDVATYLKENPGKEFFWAGIGKNSAANFAYIQFIQQFDLDISKTTEIRYGGGGEILAAIAGGHVMIGSCAASGVPSFSQDGSVKPLVVCGSKRLDSLPDVPCAAELGLDNITSDFWIGLSGSKDLPQEVIDTLAEAAANLGNNQEFLDSLAKVGIVYNYLGPDKMVDALKADAVKVKEMIMLGD